MAFSPPQAGRKPIKPYLLRRKNVLISVSLNNVIRETDRAGRGYTFEVLRAKMLFRGSIAKKGKFNYKDDR